MTALHRRLRPLWICGQKCVWGWCAFLVSTHEAASCMFALLLLQPAHCRVSFQEFQAKYGVPQFKKMPNSRDYLPKESPKC